MIASREISLGHSGMDNSTDKSSSASRSAPPVGLGLTVVLVSGSAFGTSGGRGDREEKFDGMFWHELRAWRWLIASRETSLGHSGMCPSRGFGFSGGFGVRLRLLGEAEVRGEGREI